MATELPTVAEGERAERCETCKWWVVDNKEIGAGHCHRYPPVTSIYESILRAMNARDAFLNRTQDSGQTYFYDSEFVQPYTAVRGNDFDDGEGSIPHVTDTFSWPEAWDEDFCGEWRAK